MIRTDDIHHLLPRFDRVTINGKNAVIRHKPRLCRRIICKYRAKDRCGIWRLYAGKEEDAKKEYDRQDKIHRRTRENHNHT